MYIRLTVVAFRIGNLFAFQPETLVNDKTAKLKAYQKRWKAKKEERLCLFSKRFRKVFGKGIVLNKHRFKCSEGFFVFFFHLGDFIAVVLSRLEYFNQHVL